MEQSGIEKMQECVRKLLQNRSDTRILEAKKQEVNSSLKKHNDFKLALESGQGRKVFRTDNQDLINLFINTKIYELEENLDILLSELGTMTGASSGMDIK